MRVCRVLVCMCKCGGMRGARPSYALRICGRQMEITGGCWLAGWLPHLLGMTMSVSPFFTTPASLLPITTVPMSLQAGAQAAVRQAASVECSILSRQLGRVHCSASAKL